MLEDKTIPPLESRLRKVARAPSRSHWHPHCSRVASFSPLQHPPALSLLLRPLYLDIYETTDMTTPETKQDLYAVAGAEASAP